MGKKDGDLWDDSVLLNAFEDAISKYKKIHGGKENGTSKPEEVVQSTDKSLSTIDDEIPHNKRPTVVDDDSNVASETRTKQEETHNGQPDGADHVVGSFAQEPEVQPQTSHQDYSNTQGSQEYNQLLNQYYELEEQRQKILHQLHQYGNWSYQDSGSSMQWGTVSASQEQAVASCQAYPSVVPLHSTYACQCVVAPCSFGSTCTANTCNSNQGIGNGKSPPFEGADIIKTAAGAAEKALSSMKTKSHGKGEETTEGEREESATCETDLTDVLNAWYSAGLYTGKYLAEQSIAKKRHG